MPFKSVNFFLAILPPYDYKLMLSITITIMKKRVMDDPSSEWAVGHGFTSSSEPY